MIRNSALFVVLLGFAAVSAGDEQIPGIGPVGKLVQLYTGFRLSEGAVADGNGHLYFTDVTDGPGKIYKLDVHLKLHLLVADSGGANGLALNSLGEIVACQQKPGRLAAFRTDGKLIRVLADGYQGRRFNAPNDLVIDRFGGIYFTDPWLGAPLPLPQRVEGVYYVDAQGKVTRLIDNLVTPNGITLSPDGKTLYVVQTFRPEVMAYPVEGPGRIGPGRVFCRLVRSRIPVYVGGDGMTVDEKGDAFIATYAGVQVYSATGKLLGILPIERPSHPAFGGTERTTLFITAGTSLYMLPLAVRGVPAPATKERTGAETMNSTRSVPR